MNDTTFRTGDRVRVLSFGGATKRADKHGPRSPVGLTGTVVGTSSGIVQVEVDDPLQNPRYSGAWSCYPRELELLAPPRRRTGEVTVLVTMPNGTKHTVQMREDVWVADLLSHAGYLVTGRTGNPAVAVERNRGLSA
jgi:hypothetical protein